MNHNYYTYVILHLFNNMGCLLYIWRSNRKEIIVVYVQIICYLSNQLIPEENPPV